MWFVAPPVEIYKSVHDWFLLVALFSPSVVDLVKGREFVVVNWTPRDVFIINNNNHGSTAVYGLGPPLSEVTWSCAFVAVSDQLTGRALRLNPDVTVRAIWQSVRRLWWEMAAEFCLRNISIHVLYGDVWISLILVREVFKKLIGSLLEVS
jgi:hypothetical protein